MFMYLCLQGGSRLGVHRRFGRALSDAEHSDPPPCVGPRRFQSLRSRTRPLFRCTSGSAKEQGPRGSSTMAPLVTRLSQIPVDHRVPCGALSRLEPCAVKVACTVLRGQGDSNVTPLPDYPPSLRSPWRAASVSC